MADWSNLPEDLLNFIAFRLFSMIELKRFRSICKTWRSSVSGTGNNIPFPSRPLIHFDPIPFTETEEDDDVYVFHFGAFLSRVAFFRVTPSSSTSKGYLIKSNVDVNSGRCRLLLPLIHNRFCHSYESLDLLKFTVSQIREASVVYTDSNKRIEADGFSTSVVVKVKEGEELQYGVLGVGGEGKITYWNGHVLRKLEKMVHFYDIIVHKGVTYALDSQGIVWRISSDLQISRYGSLLHETNITTSVCFGILRFVDCFGELYIVERVPKYIPRKRKFHNAFENYRTDRFKVYKMDDDDEEVGKLLEVKSLGDNAFVMASETCFTVLAHEFYGCLKNSIYFTENKLAKVFKLDDGSIITKSPSESSFEMFVPNFH